MLVHVHPDPNELGRVYRTDLPICADMREFAELAASWEDPDLYSFSTGEEALRCIHSHDYDLVASKFDLPAMNGEELARWVKAFRPRQPFVLVMNERDRCDPHQRSVADVVLHKPFTLQEAREVFYKLLESATPR